MRPWIDRRTLIDEARQFVHRNGYFLRTHAKRISSLVEIAVYNSIVSYYEDSGYRLRAMNLGPKSSFKYKVSSTGHTKNFSYFRATDVESNATIDIFHNTKVQSAHHGHLYYTPDVAVCEIRGNVTKLLKSGRRHSYIVNAKLISFVEVKHLPPFPEALFSFTGLVLEFLPRFIDHTVIIDGRATHLSPMIVFTGVPSAHSENIRDVLMERYGINIVYGTQKTNGRITKYSELIKYRTS